MATVKFRWKNCTDVAIECDRGILMELYEAYSFEVPNARFHPMVKAGRWDGWIRPVRLDGNMPVGLISNVATYLVEAGHTVQFSQEFRKFKETIEFSWDWLNLPKELDPHDHQQSAVGISLSAKRQVILSPTSSGKSLNLYALSRAYLNADMKTLIVVPSVMLANQLFSDFKDYSAVNGFDVDANVHIIAEGSAKQTSKKIVISTWQSLQYIPTTENEYFHQYDSLLVDEVHGAEAKQLKRVVESCIYAFCRIGLTGTLDGTKTMETSLIGLFGPISRVATTKELQDKGLITPVDIKAIVLKYPDDVAEIFRPKKVGDKIVKPSYAEEIKYLINYAPRNRFICNTAAACKGNTLVIVNEVDEHLIPLADMMEEMFPDRIIMRFHMGIKQKDRDTMKKSIEELDGVVIFATYKLFSTGISIKNLHNVILGHPSKSVIRILQTIGRVLRKHFSKRVANVIDIADDLRGKRKTPTYVLEHFLQRVKMYQKENFKLGVFNRDLK